MLTSEYILPHLQGRLGNNLFMIAHAYAKSLEYNKKLVVAREQVRYEGNDYSQNIFRNLEFIDGFNEEGSVINPSSPSNSTFTVYRGYFQSEKYFEKYKKEIIELFSPPQEFVERIKKEIPFIFDKETIVINVRRGDYLKLSNYHPIVSSEYMNKALEYIPSIEQILFISDDISWCKNNLVGLLSVYLENYLPHEQLWIMSFCSHFILSNSSFSWWGAYLSQNENKIVIAPETWFGPDAPQNWQDIYCKEWIVMPTYFKNGMIYPK